MKTTFFLIITVCLTVILEITAQTQNVTIDQRNSINQQVGFLRKWEGANFTDPPFSPSWNP